MDTDGADVSVKFDRVSLICSIDDKKQYSAILNFIWGANDHKSVSGYSFWKNKYCTKCTYPLGGNKFYVQAGHSQGKLYAKFKFNGHKLNQEEWNTLYTYFSLMFDFGYHSFYPICRIDSLEIAVDIKNLDFKEIHALDYKLKIANQIYKEDGNDYLGAKKSVRSFKIYDKKKQMWDKEKVLIPNELLRVEATIRPINLKLIDFDQIQNPFSSLRLFSKETAAKTEGGSSWQKFKYKVFTMGMEPQSAYLSLASHERCAIQLPLQNSTYSWWKPNKLWEEAQALIPILYPPEQIC